MAMRDEETIDFKPFFDLVIGVLFILLVLVASQLFFSRWQAEPSPQAAAARAKEMQQAAMLADIDAVLDDVAGALTANGFTPTVDRLARRVTVPAPQLLDGTAAARVAAGARFGTALLAGLRCRPTAPAGTTCRARGLAHVARLSPHLQLYTATGSVGIDPHARVAALTLAADLFGAAPELLALTAPGGSPAVRPSIAVESLPGTAAPAPAGSFMLDFTFAADDTN